MGAVVWLLPFGLQGLLMGVDEFHFHRKRGLSRVEWLGHAVDSAALLACLLLPLMLEPSRTHVRVFLGLALASCLLVTKDEFIHQRECAGGEHWIHALLFVVHPLVLLATAFLWLCLRGAADAAALGNLLGIAVPPPVQAGWMLAAQAMGVGGFLVFQVAYWIRK